MSDNDSKKYYWLKLTNDFFDSHEMKSLKAQPNGRIYALIYLELLAESTTHDGALRFSKMIPYDIPTLAAVINEDQDNLKCAINILTKMELVEILDDQTIFMEQLKEMVGSETGAAKRQREYRKQIECDNVTSMSPQCHLENRDKSIEIREKNNNIVSQIISYLNEKANKHFKVVDSNTRFINARLDEGFTLEDFKKVIDNKVADWLKDDKYNQYLRPETLFCASKFQGYLNQSTKKQKEAIPVYKGFEY